MLFRGIRGHKILWSSKYGDAGCGASEQWSVLCDTRGPVWHLSSGHQIITGSAHSDSAASPSLSDLSDIYLFVWCQLYWLHIACRAACTKGSAPCVWKQNMSCLERTQTRLGFVLKLLSHQVLSYNVQDLPCLFLWAGMQFEWINFRLRIAKENLTLGTQSWLVMTSLKQSSEIARTLGSHEQLG